jgi:hypothetical protein
LQSAVGEEGLDCYIIIKRRFVMSEHQKSNDPNPIEVGLLAFAFLGGVYLAARMIWRLIKRIDSIGENLLDPDAPHLKEIRALKYEKKKKELQRSFGD